MISSRTSRVAQVAFHLALLLALLLPQVSFAQRGGSGESAPTTPAASVESEGNNTVTFKPLTALPGIQEAANSTTFPTFLNTVYKLAIGAGAVLAVIMIMVAGVQFMTSRGSVSSNDAAKTRLRNALIGLLLVLSPTIVFGIINPSILDLSFGEALSGLKVSPLEKLTGDNLSPGQTALWTSVNEDPVAAANRCKLSQGTITFGCKETTGDQAYRTVTSKDSCAAGELKISQCSATGAQPTTKQECSAQFDSIKTFAITATSNICNSDGGFVTIANGCCDSTKTGVMCCGKPKGTGSFSFQLAYYYTTVNPSTNKRCYVPSVKAFPLKSECESLMQNLKSGKITGGKPLDDLTFTSSCTLAAEAVPPVAAGIEKCPI